MTGGIHVFQVGPDRAVHPKGPVLGWGGAVRPPQPAHRWTWPVHASTGGTKPTDGCPTGHTHRVIGALA